MSRSAPRSTIARSSGPAAPAAGTAAAQRALLDQYCVTCHNDKTKIANFSLQKADLTTVADHPEVWERVIRKLRAGMMPPPGMPRPPLAKYEGLRDWLEAQIDQKAAAHPNPGSVVLHRLNRTEYANAIRDLLDLEIDVTTLLPADDSARGFDNVAGFADDFAHSARSLHNSGHANRSHRGGLLEIADGGGLYRPGRYFANRAPRGLAFRHARRDGGPAQFPVRWRVQVFRPELRARQVYSRREAGVSDRQRGCRDSRLHRRGINGREFRR